MIGKLNIELRFCPYTLGQTDTAGTTRTAGTCYTDWCKVEQISNSRRLQEAQIVFEKAYKITKRHYDERPIVASVTEIEYNDQTLSIHDVKFIKEGRTTYEEILCYYAGN